MGNPEVEALAYFSEVKNFAKSLPTLPLKTRLPKDNVFLGYFFEEHKYNEPLAQKFSNTRVLL